MLTAALITVFASVTTRSGVESGKLMMTDLRGTSAEVERAKMAMTRAKSTNFMLMLSI